MKRTSRATRVVPTISATSTHLALIDNAFRPRPMALVAILALLGRRLSRHVCKQSFNIAASVEIQLLVGSPLRWLAHCWIFAESLAQRAFDLDLAGIGGLGHSRRCLCRRRTHIRLGCMGERMRWSVWICD